MKYFFFIHLFLLCYIPILSGQTDQVRERISIIPDSSAVLTIGEFKDADLFLDWANQPLLHYRGKISGLFPDSSQSRIMVLPDKLIPSEIICTDNGSTYFKNGKKVESLDGDRIRTLLTFKNDRFSIRPADNDNLLYIITNGGSSGSALFLLDCDSGRILKLYSCPGAIHDATGDGLITYVATDNTILMLRDNVTSEILRIKENILVLGWSDNGLFFSTPSDVGYLARPDHPFPFFGKPAKKLIPHGDTMYIHFTDGTIAILFGTDYFGGFVQRIYEATK